LLDEALARWDRGDDVVMYDEELGWYGPEAQRWKFLREKPERDRARLRALADTDIQSPSDAYELLLSRWPLLKGRIPTDLEFVQHQGYRGLASCADRVVLQAVTYPSEGCGPFPLDDLPDPFFAAVICERQLEAELLLMWRANTCRFWYCDKYLELQGEGSHRDYSPIVLMRLENMLARWDAGEETVMFSRGMGRYRPDSESWNRARQHSRSADEAGP
jgi:hypothetical protein